MTIKEKINRDLKVAIKEKELFKVNTLRQLLAVILNKEKEKKYKLSQSETEPLREDLKKKSFLEDEEIIEIIASEVKKRKEAISEFEKGRREGSSQQFLEKVGNLIEKEEKEIKILQKYLPAPLSVEEIKNLAEKVIKQIGAEGLKDMGKVMKEIIPQTKGRAEGALVSKIVRELLSSK